MSFFRWFFGLPLAAIVTVGLFALMAGLIKKDVVIGDPKPPTVVNIFPKIVESSGDAREEKPDKIKEKQPEIEIRKTLPGEKPPGVQIQPDPSEIDTNPAIETGRIGTPIIRHSPPYPENCRSRGIEGSVLVQFDVTPEGNVVNARVIDAPDRCFNRITRTVEKWKYPPAYENGRPVMRYGVVERFSFELTE